MLGIDSLKADVFVGSIAYALVGVLVFWIAFVVIDRLTPYELWREICEKQNLALAVVVAAMCVSIGLIVAAAIHG